jgi:serine/threonine protein kinase
MVNFPGGCLEYQIVRTIGEGVWTTVIEATRPKLGHRRLALKVLRNGVSPQWFAHFALINVRLGSPNAVTGIVPIHEIGVANGCPFIGMSLIEGDDLGNGIADWAARPAEETTAILQRVAATLDYAQGRGIVHGFVHPRHILRGNDGTIWVIDFAEWPPPDGVMSNPVHHAPEQLAATEITPQTDVYALAETAFWMLSGVHPFQKVRGPKVLAAKQAGLRSAISSAMPRSCRSGRTS